MPATRRPKRRGLAIVPGSWAVTTPRNDTHIFNRIWLGRPQSRSLRERAQGPDRIAHPSSGMSFQLPRLVDHASCVFDGGETVASCRASLILPISLNLSYAETRFPARIGSTSGVILYSRHGSVAAELARQPLSPAQGS